MLGPLLWVRRDGWRSVKDQIVRVRPSCSEEIMIYLVDLVVVSQDDQVFAGDVVQSLSQRQAFDHEWHDIGLLDDHRLINHEGGEMLLEKAILTS